MPQRWPFLALLPDGLTNALRKGYWAVRRAGCRLFTRLSRDRPSGLGIGLFDGHEIAYRKGTADERVIRQSFAENTLFSLIPEYRAGGKHVILDVGAHIGTFALMAADRAAEGTVHAIEASEDAYNLLRINVALNRRSGIRVHHLALADHDGTCVLHHDAGNWGHSIVKRLSASSETVECCTLATFLARHGINHCDLVKFNCEGAEFPILLGSPASVLQRFRMMLVMFHRDLWSGQTEQDLISHLTAAGFRCTLRNPSDHGGSIIAVRDP